MVIPDSGLKNSASLSALLDHAANHLLNHQGKPAQDGFLYSGNRHDTVPRALLMDKRLTPLERNAWQVFHLLLNQDGLTAFPTYDQLCPFLASMPCTPKASHETVARALTILRLARWLSLVRHQRDPKTGRVRGNLYVLHDEPLTPFEAMQLDPDYLELVSQSMEHSSKAIQRVSSQVLQDFTDDPLLQGRALPTRLQVLAQRMTENPAQTHEHYPQAMHESEDSADTLLRNREWLASDSEVSGKSSKTNRLRNPKPDSTNVRSNSKNYSIHTVPRELRQLRLPDRFLALKEDQQAGALAALQQVDAGQRQLVLDEWSVRCIDGTIRNPAGYLFGIIQKAIRGEFNAWAWPFEPSNSMSPPSTVSTTSITTSSTNPDVVDIQLQQLYSLLDKK